MTRHRYGMRKHSPTRRHFDDFFRGYVTAALWSSTVEQYAEEMEHVRHRGEGTAWDWAGHDFWLTANGHGAGFWDREDIDEALGERLSKASKGFHTDLIVGDDGQVYASPER